MDKITNKDIDEAVNDMLSEKLRPLGLKETACHVPDLRQCAVMDNNGKHCPETPEVFVRFKNGKVVELCIRCYRAWIDGVYS